MRPRYRTATAAVLGGLAAALAACSATAQDASVPETLSVHSVEDLRYGCDDIAGGYPQAAKYAGKGPHTMAIFADDLVTDDGAEREYEMANSEIPDEMLSKPRSPREVSLLACGDTLPGTQQLNTCPYTSVAGLGGPVDIPLFSQHYTFTVYELRTGRTVDTLELDSQMRQPASSCPVTFGGGSRVYAKAQPYELQDLFEDLVTGPAKP